MATILIIIAFISSIIVNNYANDYVFSEFDPYAASVPFSLFLIANVSFIVFIISAILLLIIIIVIEDNKLE